jgi:hypothetical protein
MREVNEIAGKRCRTSFERLALAEDRNRASAQMRHIVGVPLKRAYSDEIIKLSEDGEMRDYRWQINPESSKPCRMAPGSLSCSLPTRVAGALGLLPASSAFPLAGRRAAKALLGTLGPRSERMAEAPTAPALHRAVSAQQSARSHSPGRAGPPITISTPTHQQSASTVASSALVLARATSSRRPYADHLPQGGSIPMSEAGSIPMSVKEYRHRTIQYGADRALTFRKRR